MKPKDAIWGFFDALKRMMENQLLYVRAATRKGVQKGTLRGQKEKRSQN
jgi:hypothetical protein